MRRTLLFTFYASLFLLCGSGLAAQTYTLNSSSNGTTVTTCSGTLYDSGGASGNYSNNEDYSITICSDNGLPIYFQISYTVESCCDDIFVYNGASTSSPLIGNYAGTGSATVQGTGTCLTLQFESDISITPSGFDVVIGCGTAPPPPPPPPVPGCSTANPFCIDTDEVFPNQTGQPAPTGVDDFGCLGSQPNPFWYFFEVDAEGDLDLTIAQQNTAGTGIDVDFIAWGPFESVELGCGQLNSSTEVDCSYSASATEVVNIDGAELGEIYIILITNFSGQAGTLEFTQSGGAGSTDCDVLIECDIPSESIFDASCSACDGQIEIQANSVAPYTFEWTDESGATVSSIDDPTAGTSTANGLCEGDYELTLTDADGCEQTHTYTIGQADMPTATISGTTAICAGQTTDVTISCTGVGPWTVTYTIDGASPTEVTIDTSPHVISGVSTYGEYTLASIQDAAGCTGTTSGNAVISINEVSATILSSDATICDGEYAPINVELVGTGPWTVEYMVNGTLESQTSTLDLMVIDIGVEGEVELVSVTDASLCNGIVDGSLTVGVDDVPTAVLSDGGSICEGDYIDLEIDFTGIGPWTITPMIDGTLLSEITTTENPYVYPTAEAGDYQIASMSGGNCPGTTSGMAEVIVQELPFVTVSGDQSICIGAEAEIDLSISASGEWSLDYEIDGIPQPTINSNSTTYQTIEQQTASYTFSSISDDHCTNDELVEFSVATDAGPEAILSGGGGMCEGDSVAVEVQLSGEAPWTVTLSENGLPLPPLTTSDPSYLFYVNETSQFSITEVSDMVCVGTSEGDATIEVAEAPEAILSGESLLCSGSSSQVQVTFSGSGTYTFDHAIDGSPQGVITTADNPYIIETTTPGEFSLLSITDDNCSGSTSGILEVVEQASPTATLGDDLDLCVGEVGSLLIDLSGSGNWLVDYTVDGVPQPTIEATSNETELFVNESGEYILTAVSDAICSGTAMGSATVGIHELPTASISGDVEICEGEDTVFDVSLTGQAPWTILVSNGTATSEVTTSMPDYDLPVDEDGSYTITQVADAFCESNGSGMAMLTVHPLPTGSLLGNGVNCEGLGGTIAVILEGAPGFEFVYTIDGEPQDTLSSMVGETVIETGIDGEYELTEISDQYCIGLAEGMVDVTTLPLPSASIEGEYEICSNQSFDIPVELEGTGPWSISYTIDGELQPTIMIDDPDPLIPSQSDGVYELVSVQDFNCQNVAMGSVSIDYFPPIDVSVSEDTAICTGGVALLDGTASGGQSDQYDFHWTIDEVQFSPDESIIVSPTSSTLYVLSVAGACGIPYADSVTVDVQEYPSILIDSGDIQLCGAGVAEVANLTPSQYWGECEWSIQDATNGQVIAIENDCSGLSFPFDSLGTFDLTLMVSSPIGCISEEVYEALIHVESDPVADWFHSPSDPNIIENVVNFYDRSYDADEHHWYVTELSEEFSDKPNATFTFPTGDRAETYEVCKVVSNESGCTDTLCAPVHIDGALVVWMPSAFTPNADRLNEVFRPSMIGVDVEEYTFRIFDRGGELLWETHDPAQGWNGQGAEVREFYTNDGVYNWQILIKQVEETEKVELQGVVTVVR